MNKVTSKLKDRLISIDALRGLAMFLILAYDIGGLSSLFTSNVQNFIQAVAAMMVMWLIMYWMHCKKTFIKI
jgi:uncharacterized membrane protein